MVGQELDYLSQLYGLYTAVTILSGGNTQRDDSPHLLMFIASVSHVQRWKSCWSMERSLGTIVETSSYGFKRITGADQKLTHASISAWGLTYILTNLNIE